MATIDRDDPLLEELRAIGRKSALEFAAELSKGVAKARKVLAAIRADEDGLRHIALREARNLCPKELSRELRERLGVESEAHFHLCREPGNPHKLRIRQEGREWEVYCSALRDYE